LIKEWGRFTSSLAYPYAAIAAGLAVSLLTGSTHWQSVNFRMTALAAFGIVTVFDKLILTTLADETMTPSRYLFRTMLVVVAMQFAFACIYHFAADATTYLAKGGSRVTDFVDALYFSGVTLLTVGYGDVIPVGDFRFTAVAEVYGGTLFIFSFFACGLSVMSNRTLRQPKKR